MRLLASLSLPASMPENQLPILTTWYQIRVNQTSFLKDALQLESIEETMDTYGHLFPSDLIDLGKNLNSFAFVLDIEASEGSKTA